MAALRGWDRQPAGAVCLGPGAGPRTGTTGFADAIIWGTDRLDLAPTGWNWVTEPIGREGGRIPVAEALRRLAANGAGSRWGISETGSAGWPICAALASAASASGENSSPNATGAGSAEHDPGHCRAGRPSGPAHAGRRCRDGGGICFVHADRHECRAGRGGGATAGRRGGIAFLTAHAAALPVPSTSAAGSSRAVASLSWCSATVLGQFAVRRHEPWPGFGRLRHIGANSLTLAVASVEGPNLRPGHDEGAVPEWKTTAAIYHSGDGAFCPRHAVWSIFSPRATSTRARKRPRPRPRGTPGDRRAAPGAAGQAGKAPALDAAAANADPSAKAARVKIESLRAGGSISLAGGRIDDLELTGYHDTLDPKSPYVRLLSPTTQPSAARGQRRCPRRRSADRGAKPYYAVYGWMPPPAPTRRWSPDRRPSGRSDPAPLAPGKPGHAALGQWRRPGLPPHL